MDKTTQAARQQQPAANPRNQAPAAARPQKRRTGPTLVRIERAGAWSLIERGFFMTCGGLFACFLAGVVFTVGWLILIVLAVGASG